MLVNLLVKQRLDSIWCYCYFFLISHFLPLNNFVTRFREKLLYSHNSILEIKVLCIRLELSAINKYSPLLKVQLVEFNFSQIHIKIIFTLMLVF